MDPPMSACFTLELSKRDWNQSLKGVGKKRPITINSFGTRGGHAELSERAGCCGDEILPPKNILVGLRHSQHVACTWYSTDHKYAQVDGPSGEDITHVFIDAAIFYSSVLDCASSSIGIHAGWTKTDPSNVRGLIFICMCTCTQLRVLKSYLVICDKACGEAVLVRVHY